MRPGTQRRAGQPLWPEWVDVWREERHVGPSEVTVLAPIDQPPVLCRVEQWPELRAVFRFVTA